MWKKRIAWGIIIICAAILYLFDNGTVTLALLICTVLVPLASIVLLLIFGKKVRVQLETKDDSAGELRVTKAGHLPLGEVCAIVRCENLRTGQCDQAEIRTPADRSERCVPLELNKPHAGKHEISLISGTLSDALGLIRCSIQTEGTSGITVYPEVFPIHASLSSSSAVMLESDRYSDRRSGNDPGEVREIREYVPGDPVRNIHWKLSEKTDKLLVKELGMPVTDQLMVLLDTSDTDADTDYDAMDTVASVFVSLLQTLASEGYEFNAGWNDKDGQPVQRKIRTSAQIIEAADSFLAAPPGSGSLLSQIEQARTDSRFSHLVITGSRIPDGIDAIAGGAQVTLLLCGWDNAAGEGMNIIGFHKDNYRQELAGIEI